MGQLGIVASKLQRIVGFYGTTDLGAAAAEKGPTTVPSLANAEVGDQFPLELFVGLAHIVHHQDILGGDGTIGLQLKTPIPVRSLQAEQRVRGILDCPLQFEPVRTG